MSAPVVDLDLWQRRLQRLVDQQIEALLSQEPGLLERVRPQARQRAWQSLGLASLHNERQALTRQSRQLKQQLQRVQQAMLAVVRRVPVAAVAAWQGRGLHPDVRRALQRRQALHEHELLAEAEPGRLLLRLRQEKEQLQDTVALALAPPAIQDLWWQVLALAGADVTPLQRLVLDRSDPGPRDNLPPPSAP